MSEERFRERLQDVIDSVGRLRQVVDLPDSDVVRDSTIQRFEFTFEVTWKALKDYLEHQGLVCSGPRSALRQAFQSGLIPSEEESDRWMELLEDRNSTSHAYNSALAARIYADIVGHHAPLLETMAGRLRGLSVVGRVATVDLRPRDREALRRIFRAHPSVKSVRLFGSRATGRAGSRSDIDLAVEAPDAKPGEWSAFVEAVEESPIIHTIDLVRLERLPPGRLRERIASEGVVIHP